MNELTLKGIALKKLDRVINPHFPTKFIWSLFTLGALLSLKKVLFQWLVSFQLLTQSFYLSITLSDDAEAVVFWCGIVLITVSIFFFYRIHVNNNEIKSYISLKAAAGDIRKYLEENRRVFKECGPNSGKTQFGELHQDMGVWELSKKEIIVPNNQAIYELIKAVKNITPAQKTAVDKMLLHIEHFKAHVEDPTIDYTKHQFPQEFSDLIYSFGKPSKKREKLIEEVSKWLQKEFTNLNVVSAKLFGSALYSDNINDFDLVVQTNDSNIEAIKENAEAWKCLESKFHEKFSLRLHLQVFSKLEESSHTEFVAKLTVKRDIL